MPDFTKVKSGDKLKIPADTYNAFIDAANDFRQRTGSGVPGAIPLLANTGIVSVRNDSGGDRAQFQILCPNGIVFSPTDSLPGFKKTPILKGVTPTAAEAERCIILQEPIKDGKIGKGLLVGVTPVQIDVIDESDEWADAIHNSPDTLRSQPFGSSWIAYKESGTGVKWAIVVHGVVGSKFLIGKTAASHSKGASGTINIYRGETAGSESFSGTVSAYNRFGDIGSGKWVLCVRVQRNWNVICAEC